MKFKTPTSFLLLILFSFFGTALVFNLISPPAYGQTSDAWNIHRQGANDLDFYYYTGVPPTIALKLNTSGSAQIRSLIDMDNTTKTVDPSGITNLSFLNVTSSGITAYFDRTYTAALNYSHGASALIRATTAGDMTDGFGPTLRFDIQDIAGVTNYLAHIGAIRDGADNSGAIIFRSANAGVDSEKMRISPGGNVGIGTTSPLQLLTVGTAASTAIHLGTSDPATGTWIRNNGGDVVFSSKVVGDMYYGYNGPSTLDHNFGAVAGNPTLFVQNAAGGYVGIGKNAPSAKLDVDGSITQSASHGNNMKLWLSAARNGGGTGEAGLYSWISEPGATWTGAAIARNMVNTTASFPRVNTGLSGQMMHFAESGNIEFTLETAAGARTTPVTLTNTGNVGINMPSSIAPATKFDVYTSDNKHMSVINYIGFPALVGHNNGFSAWSDIFLGVAGNVGIGQSTVAPAHKLQVFGDARIDGRLAVNGYGPGGCNAGPPAGTYGLCVGGFAYAQNGFVNGSDIRLKKDIFPIKDSLHKILSLEGVTFKYNKDTPNGDKYPDTTQIGFIAQQVEPFIPELVITGADGYKAMNYANLTAILTEAIKEQQKQINNFEKTQFDQKQTIQNLEEQINLIKQELQELKNK